MKTKDITPSEYAKLGILRGNTAQNISKHLRAGNMLPGVLKVKKFSRFYVLEVAEDFTTVGYKEIILSNKNSKNKK